MEPSILGVTGIAAISAAIIAGWSQVKSTAQQLAGLVVLQRHLHDDVTSKVAIYLRSKYKRLPSGVATVCAVHSTVDDRDYNTVIPFLMPHTTSVWSGPRGVFVFNISGDGSTLLSLRRLSDPEGLISDALDADDARTVRVLGESNNFVVYQLMGKAGQPFEVPQAPRSIGNNDSTANVAVTSGGHRPYLGVDRSFRFEADRYMNNQSNRNPLRGLFYSKQEIDLIEDMKRWYAQRSWYQQRGIPWRTGVLLHGPGGTGKSSLSKAIAQTLGIRLYQFNLNTFSDKDFVEEWRSMITPCVVALEDFDTVFHGRTSVTAHKSLSFECVLNQISGISSMNGVLVVVTTNNLEQIDPALGRLDEQGRPTRPGRIDRILYMGPTTTSQRESIAEYTLDFLTEQEREALVMSTVGTTAAQFQAICIEKALVQLVPKGNT